MANSTQLVDTEDILQKSTKRQMSCPIRIYKVVEFYHPESEVPKPLWGTLMHDMIWKLCLSFSFSPHLREPKIPNIDKYATHHTS